jgi:hypothetical protein
LRETSRAPLSRSSRRYSRIGSGWPRYSHGAFGNLGIYIGRLQATWRHGDSTIEIHETTVDTIATRGDITSVNPREGSIEVIFINAARGANGKNVRIYKLSVDGTKLVEIRGGQIIATRMRCEDPRK